MAYNVSLQSVVVGINAVKEYQSDYKEQDCQVPIPCYKSWGHKSEKKEDSASEMFAGFGFVFMKIVSSAIKA